MRVGSLILAGGRSRRMGKPKESLPIGAATLLGRTVDVLLGCTRPVVVIGRGGDQQLPPIAAEAVTLVDDDPGAGPLAALVTGLSWLRRTGALAGPDAVFVTGCDAPFLDAAAVGWLASQLGDHQLVIPKVDGKLQPLCAVYRVDCLAAAQALLATGIDMPRALAERVRTRVLEATELARLDPQLRFLRSVNTPEEYEQALQDLRR